LEFTNKKCWRFFLTGIFTTTPLLKPHIFVHNLQ
jgi:hypothetical protein